MGTPEIVAKRESDSNIDLHIHSHFSDGINSPEEIREEARQEGVKLFSITDHNYIGADARLIKDGQKKFSFLQGIEISSLDRVTDEPLHILGYSYNFNIPQINRSLASVVEGYNIRAKNIIAKLNDKFSSGFDFEEIKKETPAAFVSRNLLAKKLTEFVGNGMIMTEALNEAFIDEDNSWLPGAEDVIGLIQNCGGIAVLAHPGNILEKTSIEELIKRLGAAGLGGIEAFYPKHSPKTTGVLINLAKKYQLIITAGSDWHGRNFSASPLGIKVPAWIYESCIIFFSDLKSKILLKKNDQTGSPRAYGGAS